MKKILTLALFSFLFSNSTFAQSPVLQNGPWVFGHLAQYSNRGFGPPTISDAGAARGGNVGTTPNELSLTAIGTGTPPFIATGTGPLGTNFCDYDGPATGTNYHFLCFSANSQGGGLIDYGAAGTATPLPLQFIVNGVKIQFPFVIGGIVGPSTSVVGDLACWANTVGTLLSDCGTANTIIPVSVTTTGTSITLTPSSYFVVINKAVGSPTTVLLLATPATGQTVIIKDGKGDAGINNITINGNGKLIDGFTTFVLNQGHQSINLTFNGTQWNTW
jgi:hypothetical protein